MKLTITPAGRSMKVFASATGSFAGAVLFLALSEYLGYVRHPEDVLKGVFSMPFVAAMVIISLGMLVFMTLSSIFAYIHACKESQKKFLIFALPAQIIATALMLIAIGMIFKQDQDSKKVACIFDLISGLVSIYIVLISTVFKHIAYGKARKAN